MKTRGLRSAGHGRRRSHDHRGTRTDKSPPVSGEYAYPEPAVCAGCGAVYVRKTWRLAGPRRLVAPRQELERVSCPACRQVREGRAYGRVLLTGEWVAAHEDEVRRRIRSVESRGRHTQPERRLVGIALQGDGLEVTTTSQKLAHRITRELEKAFGGSTSYAWSDHDGSLWAMWSNPRSPAGRGSRRAARRRRSGTPGTSRSGTRRGRRPPSRLAALS
jgi:hypothetical protein